MTVYRIKKGASKMLLRCGVFRQAPAVGYPLSIQAVNKVTDDYVALTLQPEDQALKALVALFAVIALLLQLLGADRRAIR